LSCRLNFSKLLAAISIFLAATALVGTGFGLGPVVDGLEEDAVDLVAAFFLLATLEEEFLGGGGMNPATGTGDKPMVFFLLGIKSLELFLNFH
jgi:hypothetical protein